MLWVLLLRRRLTGHSQVIVFLPLYQVANPWSPVVFVELQVAYCLLYFLCRRCKDSNSGVLGVK